MYQGKKEKYLKSIFDEKTNDSNKNYKITRKITNKQAESIIGGIRIKTFK